MKITLNGQPKDLAGVQNLKEIINRFCKDPNHIVAEVNGDILKNSVWDETSVKDGDIVELVSFVGGGVGANGRSPLPFVIAGKTFSSRFLLGTGKFKNKTDVTKSIAASETQIVTVALRRIDLERHEENILEYIPEGVTLLTNTSGARDAKEAVRIAHLARESGYGDWIKIEVINDSKYLLPDNAETIKATKILVGEGFVVLPYMHPDLYTARALVKAGAATVMPLGSLIGSNQGLKTKEFIKILIDEIDIPIIVDAGIGAPSQAAEAMEMGADAVLANTAVATAEHPALLARAFSLAIQAGRLGYLGRGGPACPPEIGSTHRSTPTENPTANASSPLTGFLYESC